LSAGWSDDHPPLLPPDPEFPPLHNRDYQVRAWRTDEATILIRGAVMDIKPGEMIAERIRSAGGVDDGRPITIHHMIVDLYVGVPQLVIKDVTVAFERNPQPACPHIASSYQGLIGLSISRGFTHKVRELFGGPRGCTHTTALLQAMAPVALQCMFSFRAAGPGGGAASSDTSGAPPEASFMRDTCHVWSGEGELWQGVTVGRTPPMPLPMQERLRASGLSPDRVDLRRPDPQSSP